MNSNTILDNLAKSTSAHVNDPNPIDDISVRVTSELPEVNQAETNSDVTPKYRQKTNRIASESETIKEWWVGRVLEIFPEQRYFTAHLRDLKFVESIADFDFDSAFNDDIEVNTYLFEGSEFAFFILIRHGQGSPQTISRLEFSSPYLWQENDSKKADKLYRELFPGDDFI